MWQLGMPTPVLQYRVELPGGGYALLDFAWPDLGRWGEFDGKIKYQDPALLDGRTSERVMADQRQRQRRIERSTGWECGRWGFDEMTTIADFAKHLRTIGLYGARG
ncbi:hypothetical protein [Microbacterium elymi]|uniref:Uncharacterized protein n=1 Tax=Microbacterium elymi TaxID=2909587 RepID=A0ABY5NLB6_9MICO|nr:hypothetical protein [Microbacterium elymi]UUT35911.1 hypothetical protein L2X98_22450 [Microbacterium elymi]